MTAPDPNGGWARPPRPPRLTHLSFHLTLRRSVFYLSFLSSVLIFFSIPLIRHVLMSARAFPYNAPHRSAWPLNISCPPGNGAGGRGRGPGRGRRHPPTASFVRSNFLAAGRGSGAGRVMAATAPRQPRHVLRDPMAAHGRGPRVAVLLSVSAACSERSKGRFTARKICVSL